eukprot:TRINITY_DN1595_c0_g1_i1.p1 TRINITY_DN1595_c0_g1~~TRINITY_DN1595_c0_g1_i1.p1  ORF type:complete len:269 (+),score=43.93 TRINITY_DN1595_c0_g1_i1:125-931(+)
MEVENMSQKELMSELREARIDTSKFFELSDLVGAVKMLRSGELKGGVETPVEAPAKPAASSPPRAAPTTNNVVIKQEIKRILKTKCYYEILSVSKTATENEISKSYKKLAMRLHPDKCREERGEEAFKIVTQAYDTLSKKRDQYDASGGDPERMNGGGGMPTDFNPEDIFREMFGGMGAHGMGGGMPGGVHFTSFGGGPAFTMNFGGPPRRRRQQQQQQQQRHQHQPNPLSLSPTLALLCIPLFIMLLPLISSLLPYLFIFMFLWGRR